MTTEIQEQASDLATLATEMAKATKEVKDIGAEVLRQSKNGEDTSKELKAKVDEALEKQGDIGQRMKDLEQAVAKGLQDMGRGEVESLGSVLDKFFEDHPEEKALLVQPRQGKHINIPISRKALLGSTDTGEALNYPGQQLPMVAQLQRRLTVRDLLMPGRTEKSVVFYPRETGFTGGPEIVAEGAAKPEFNIEIENVTATVPTIAHWTDISLQMLDDVPYIRSFIEGRMLYQLKLVEENQFLNGSGTAGNMLGLYTAATAYAQPAGAQVTNEQAVDRLRLMLLQVELADAFSTGIVLHPTSWANLELLKDSQMGYLFTNPQASTTGRIWGRDVVSTKAMATGNALVGDFRTHAQVLDRQDANVAISFENKDNFVKNMATIRVEERALVAIYRPEAFVKGSLVIAGG